MAEFEGRVKSWFEFHRCFFTRLYRDDAGQYVMGYAKPDSIIFTNIGSYPFAGKRLRTEGRIEGFKNGTINIKKVFFITSK